MANLLLFFLNWFYFYFIFYSLGVVLDVGTDDDAYSNY